MERTWTCWAWDFDQNFIARKRDIIVPQRKMVFSLGQKKEKIEGNGDMCNLLNHSDWKLNKIIGTFSDCHVIFSLVIIDPIYDIKNPFTNPFPCAGGLMCNRTWDGWMCWDDVEVGITATQHCPDYYHDFDTSGNFFPKGYIMKYCIVECSLFWSNK